MTDETKIAVDAERTRCIEIVRQGLAACAYSMGIAGMPPKVAEIINEVAITIIEAMQDGTA